MQVLQNFLTNQAVLVLGLGESGIACATFARASGATVRVVDTRPAFALSADAAASLAGCEITFSALHEIDLTGIQRVAISPGIAPNTPEMLAFAARLNAAKIPLESEIDWFSLAIKDLQQTQAYDCKILAITGTNGKTTVTKLTEFMLKRAGIHAVACGNVSPAALTALLQALQAQLHDGTMQGGTMQGKNALPAVWVLELSSFQLHYTQHLNAHAATVLNISQDHLDWHGDMAAYAAAKARIFGENTLRIATREGAPSLAGEYGVISQGGLEWLCYAQAEENEKRRKPTQSGTKLKKKKTETTQVFAVQRLMPADALRIRGRHNHSNALAALALCHSVVVADAAAGSDLLHALREYSGEPHRCTLLAVVDDVSYVDDSKGTNVGATVAALDGLGGEQNSSTIRKNIILLAGGDGKGQDFAPLIAPCAKFAKALCVFGKDANLIAKTLDQHVPVHTFETLNEAVLHAKTLATTGDTVLLSPACASLDQFKNYVHRAEVFAQCVQAIAMGDAS